jgi:hypothetical protein
MHFTILLLMLLAHTSSTLALDIDLRGDSE